MVIILINRININCLQLMENENVTNFYYRCQ